MSKSTRPDKPRPDFPLFVHDSKHPARARWAKKIRGSFVYFGKWIDDARGEKALELWLDQKDDLLAGRKPRPKDDGTLTVDYLADQFLYAKNARVEAGEMNLRTWKDYQALLAIVVGTLGRNRAAADIGPDDWAKLRKVFSEKWGPTRLANAIVYTKGVWKWGWENGHLAVQMRFGSGFNRPPAKTIRAARNAKGPRMFQPEQLRAILDVAGPNVKALTLLGINGALGNTDCAMLPITAIDLENGWLNYPRQKTAIMRRIPLWPETIEAIRQVLVHRPTPSRGNEGLLFVRDKGGSYAGQRAGVAVSQAFADAAKTANVTERTFYDLRRTFQTIGEGAKDPVGVSAIMGHAAGSNDMASVYRQRIDDDRLRAVVGVVRAWLYGPQTADDGDGGQNTSGAVEGLETGDMDAGGPVLLAFCCSYAA